MSSWGSNPDIGGDDEGAPPGVVLESTGGLYPRPGRDRPAKVGTSTVPGYCVPGHHEDADDPDLDWPVVGPWLRLDVTTDWCRSVALDEAAVRSLRDELTAWLKQPKVRPR